MARLRNLTLAFGVLACSAITDAAPARAASVLSMADLDGPPGWQQGDGSWVKHSSPTLADLDRDGKPEIVVGSRGGKLYAYRFAGGQLQRMWDSGGAIDTFIDSSPAVTDLDGDGCPEVLVGAGDANRTHNSGLHVFDCNGHNHRFYATPVGTQSNHIGVFSSPSVGDVNNDGSPDFVYGSFNERTYVKKRDGSDMPGFEGGRLNHDTIWSSPALADIDGNGSLEVVIGTDLGGGASVFGCPKPTRGTLTLYDFAGRFSAGFPRCGDTPVWSSPAVVDLNGDGQLESIFGTNNYTEGGGNVGNAHTVRAANTFTGAELWSRGLDPGARIFASPAVGNTGGDGRPEVAVGVIFNNNSGKMYLLDADGGVRWARTTTYVAMGSPVMGDVTGDGVADVVHAGAGGELYAWNHNGDLVIDRLYLGKTFFNSPAIGDLDGDGRNEIVVASGDHTTNPPRGRLWVIGSDGRGGLAWPMFRLDAAHTAAIGKGPFREPGGAAPAVVTTPKPTRRPTAPRPAAPPKPAGPTAAPTPDPTLEPTPEPTPAPTAQAFASPAPVAASRGFRVAGLIAAAALVASGGAIAFARVRR